MTDLLTPVVNKVPGYHSKVLTALANKPPNMQIFAPPKFGINPSGHAEFARKTALGNRPKFALMEFVIEKMGSWKMSEIFCRKMSYEKLCCWKTS